jgi:hypothetical protein
MHRLSLRFFRNGTVFINTGRSVPLASSSGQRRCISFLLVRFDNLTWLMPQRAHDRFSSPAGRIYPARP